MTEIVTEETLEAVEEAEATKDEEFLVLSYDLPTENTSWDDLDEQKQEELAKELKSIRLKLQEQFALKGVQLSQSTYIVRAQFVSTLVSMVDQRYASLDFDIIHQVRDRVELHIVGNSYKHVVKDILRETLDEGLEELSTQLQVIEAKVRNHSYDDETEVDKDRRRMWDMSTRVDQLENRAEDIALLSEELGSHYQEKVANLKEFRQGLLDESTFSGSHG